MNIITCAENCRYQQDGYCTLEQLDQIDRLDSFGQLEQISDNPVSCRYFAKK